MAELPEIVEVEETELPTPVSPKSEIPKIALIQVLCTIAIILALYAFSNRTILILNEKIDSHEYSKVGGEENYRMLQEIQKDQVNSMIRDYSVTNPEYIEQIKKKIRSNGDVGVADTSEKKRLTSDEIASLKSQALILGNSGALISLIEFSDFTCEHCRDFHNKEVLTQLESTSSGSVNLVYKSIPGRKNVEGLRMTALARCAYTLSGSVAYTHFTDRAFQAKSADGTMFNASGALNYMAKELGVSDQLSRQCEQSVDTKTILDREYGQSIYLGIQATPSILVLNSKTGYYQIIGGNVDQNVLDTAIVEVTNN